MSEGVVAQVADTASAAQPSQTPPVEIEIVDTPTAPVAEAVAAPAANPPLYFGKYRTVEDAEKAYSEAQRAMHEKAQEAATYRKLLDERAAAPPPQYQQPPAVDLDGKFRERLAENPAETIFEMTRFAAKQMIEEQTRAQRELVKKYQTYSSRPEYASVAQEVASQLPFAHEQPIDPVEVAFMRAKLAKMEAAMANTASNVNVPYVEPGGAARRTGAGAMRVELDPDTAKMRQFDERKVRDLARIVAMQKNNGGTMREMTIDDWEKSNA